MVDQKPEAESVSIYRPSDLQSQSSDPFMITMLSIFGAVVVLIGILFVKDKPFDIGGIVFAILPIGSAVYIYFAIKRFREETYLIITPTEVEYHKPGITIKTNWSNIAALRSDYGNAYLILRDRSADYMSAHTAIARRTTLSSWNVDKQIPLHLFTIWLPKSPIYKKIQEVAPHLLKHK